MVKHNPSVKAIDKDGEALKTKLSVEATEE